MAEERIRRRLAAILAADTVGYSRLMEIDEAGTLALFNTLRQDVFDPATAHFGGRIFKTTGDGALAEFPSAVDAVQCAVDIQRALGARDVDEEAGHRITLRIGISLGDVIVEGDDLYGNGVNVAARLEGMADPGGICISGNVHEHVRSLTDIGFEDLGDQQVKNIERPVRAFRVLLDAPAANMTNQPSSRSVSTWRRWPAAAAAVIALITGGLAWWQPLHPDVEKASVEKMAYALPDKPSVAVLPFTNMSDARDQEHIADGITEDIITDLSKVGGLFVIARNSSFTYKDKPVKIRQVAEDLGVRYVLEGSVQHGGDRIRINARLIDAVEGGSVWAERYERQLKDVFTVQSDVIRKVVSELAVTLNANEQERLFRPHTRNLEAYETFLRARRLRTSTRDTDERAKKLYERVVELDPDFAGGYAGLSYIHSRAVRLGFSKNRKEDAQLALDFAQKAMAIDSEMSWSLLALGGAYIANREFDKAVATMEHAVALHPSDADALTFLANFLHWSGRGEEAIAAMTTAARLNPHQHLRNTIFLAYSNFTAGRYEKTVGLLGPHFERYAPSGNITITWLAAAYAALGETARAQEVLQAYLRKHPEMTLDRFPFQRAYKRKEDSDRLIGFLRKAGMPDHKAPAVPRLSIVVLPFDNLSGAASQDYFADGITEDLITDLSRIRDAFVIARGTSFTYKGKAVNARDAAKELNVRYVLEGSVRRSGDRVRVNAQLIDGQTGSHVWGHRFDLRLEEIFSLQDEVTSRIAGALKFELRHAESRKLRQGPPSNLTAWELALQGAMTLLTKPRSTETYLRSKALLEKALSLDPTLSSAWTGLARIYQRAGTSGMPGMKRADARRRLLEVAERAVLLDPYSSEAHAFLGNAYRLNRQVEKARAVCERAVDLNPNDDLAYSCLGRVMTGLGRTEEAIPLFAKSLRLNPRHTAAQKHYYLGLSYLLTGRHEEAVRAFLKSSSIDAAFATPHQGLASALAWMGRIEEAKKALATFTQKDLGKMTTIAKVKARLGVFSPDIEYLLEGLRRAGMPEN